MKPGPAISALATSSSAASFGAIASASARGLVPARLASTIAALVARSPCAGSRGGSTATAPRSSPGGKRALGLEGVERGVEMRGKAGVERHVSIQCSGGAALDQADGYLKTGAVTAVTLCARRADLS